jgi:hypothetical protein
VFFASSPVHAVTLVIHPFDFAERVAGCDDSLNSVSVKGILFTTRLAPGGGFRSLLTGLSANHLRSAPPLFDFSSARVLGKYSLALLTVPAIEPERHNKLPRSLLHVAPHCTLGVLFFCVLQKI